MITNTTKLRLTKYSLKYYKSDKEEASMYTVEEQIRMAIENKTLGQHYFGALVTGVRILNLKTNEWEKYEVAFFKNGLYAYKTKQRLKLLTKENIKGYYKDIFLVNLEDYGETWING